MPRAQHLPLWVILLVAAMETAAVPNAMDYRVKLQARAPEPVVTVKTTAEGTLVLQVENVPGLDRLPVTHGGISTCRTIVEHRSEAATVILSLAIPDPRAPCAMLPSHATVLTPALRLKEVPLTRLSGKDQPLRRKVAAALGTLTVPG